MLVNSARSADIVPRVEILYVTTLGPVGAGGAIHDGVASFGTVAPEIRSIDTFNFGDTHQGEAVASQLIVCSKALVVDTKEIRPIPATKTAEASHKRFIYLVYSTLVL
jgi:hypothetical protein